MRVLKTVFEVTLVIAVLASTIIGYYWVMTRYFAMPKEGAILILAPTTLLAGLTAIYAYYLGWRRYQNRQRSVSGKSIIPMLVLSVFVLGQAVLAVYFLKSGNVGLAMLCFLIACVTGVWGLRRSWSELERGLDRDVASTWDASRTAFERRFRIFVFGLLLILPASLALFAFLRLRDMPEGILFAIIAAVVAPWVIRKIRAEMQTREQR